MLIPPPRTDSSRRGNALVLAASVLVLLVIIATTFVSRTQTGRTTAAAIRKEAERQDSVDGVGESVAQLIADSLFVRPVDATYIPTGPNGEYAMRGLVNPLPGEDPNDPDSFVDAYASLSSQLPALNPSFEIPPVPGTQTYIEQFEYPGLYAATNPNRPRLSPQLANTTAISDRFAGFDLSERYSTDPWFPGNFAPYEVVPFTNWPDGLDYPWSPSTPLGVLGRDTNGFLLRGSGPASLDLIYGNISQLYAEGNPLLGPGFGDTRWLRDIEPIAVDQNADGLLDSFFQWRHLTNISTPENGWRVVLDISDVFGTKELIPLDSESFQLRTPNLVEDLSVPVEQWVESLNYPALSLSSTPIGQSQPLFEIGSTGALGLPASRFASDDIQDVAPYREFWEQLWARWGANLPASSRGLYGPVAQVTQPVLPPPNLFDLNDLNANGRKNEPGERPIDRYIGLRQTFDANGDLVTRPDDPQFSQGTSAWNISRYLDDADGDGWTDSFWFLAPGVKDGVRNLVSVSITDNAGRLDLSTATRYSPGLTTQPSTLVDFEQQMQNTGTTGFTPADLSLVSVFDADAGNANGTIKIDPEARVGFFDAPVHREGSAPTRNGFLTFDAIFSNSAQDFDTRLDSGPILTWLEERGWFTATGGNALEAFLPAEERLSSFASGDRAPWSQFDLSSELELRANESLNKNDTFTRAEKSAGSWRRWNTDQGSPLRGHLFAEETTPFLDGLTTFEWKADLRHRTTVLSRTRNDLLPSWLRWRWRPSFDGFNPTVFSTPLNAEDITRPLWQIPGLATFTDDGLEDDFGSNVRGPSYTWLPGQRTWLNRNGVPYFPSAQNDDALPGVNGLLFEVNEFTDTFLSQVNSRLDLRESNPYFLDLWTDRNGIEGPSGQLMMAKRLPHSIFHALSDGDVFGTYVPLQDGGPVFGNTYFGSVQNRFKFSPTDETIPFQSLANTRWLKMASAGLSANILAYRDDDWITLADVPESDEQDPDVVAPRFNDIAPLYDQYNFSNPDFNDAPQQEGAIPLPAWGWEATANADSANLTPPENLAMLGLEMQPFLVEAFVGHFYSTRVVPDDYSDSIGGGVGVPPIDPVIDGTRFVDGSCERTTVVAVQIANPFDKPIPAQELAKYRISVSGRHFPLSAAVQDDLELTEVQLDNYFSIPANGLSPLEPTTESRPSSAIFYMCDASWSNGERQLGETNPQPDAYAELFPRRIADWLDLACEQDIGLDFDGPELQAKGPLVQADLDHPPSDPNRWGRTGTLRYRVPSLANVSQSTVPPQSDPYGLDFGVDPLNGIPLIGWSDDPAYYQRGTATTLDGGQASGNEESFPGTLPPMNQLERVVELSRIDHDASIRSFVSAQPPVEGYDSDGDGQIDPAFLNHPLTVWVVVDRFDNRTLPTQQSGDEIVRGPQTGSLQIRPEYAVEDLQITGENIVNDWKDVLAAGRMQAALQGSGAFVDAGPEARNYSPNLVNLPWPSVTGNDVITDPTSTWVPGIFFNTIPKEGFDTLVSYASTRRSWGWDTDFELTNPSSWGVQSHESHPRFTSALQHTTSGGSPLTGIYFRDSVGQTGAMANGTPIPLSSLLRIKMRPASADADPCNTSADPTSQGPDGCVQPFATTSTDGGQQAWGSRQQFSRQLQLLLPQTNGQFWSKPTRFSGGRNVWRRFFEPAGVPYFHDKAFYHTPQPFQLVHKDDDFQQAGEVLNIPLVGHLVDFDPLRPFNIQFPQAAYLSTVRTFSEFLAPMDPYNQNGFNQANYQAAPNHIPAESTVDRLLLGTKARGRLALGKTIGAAQYFNNNNSPLSGQSFTDSNHNVPSLPAGERLLELFVVDGPGFNYDDQSYFVDRTTPPLEPGLRGTVAGLINLNTAPAEVMRALPGWYRTLEPDSYINSDQALDFSNRTWFAEAVRSWRDRARQADMPYPIQDQNGNFFPYASNFAFDRSYRYPKVQGTNDFFAIRNIGPHRDVRSEDTTSGLYSLLPDPAVADDVRPFFVDAFNASSAAPVSRRRGFSSIGSLRSVDLSVGLNGDNAVSSFTDEGSQMWPVELPPQDKALHNQAGSSFTLGSYHRNRQPLAPFRSLQDRDQFVIDSPAGFVRDTDGDGQPGPLLPGVGPLGRTLDDGSGFARDPGFGISVPYDVAGNGNTQAIDLGNNNFRLVQDTVSGDMEDANLLVSAASNLVTTRSDTFTVHFRVRSFRQNPETRVWDATDPEFIVGENRYVMVVDRTDVNQPGDKPKILMISPVRN